MENLNQIELQNIRHICGHGTGFCSKINYYKTVTSDSNVTDTLESIENELTQLKTELTNMLGGN